MKLEIEDYCHVEQEIIIGSLVQWTKKTRNDEAICLVTARGLISLENANHYWYERDPLLDIELQIKNGSLELLPIGFKISLMQE